MVSIRAIYRDGQLRPLDPVNLKEGQEVQLQILTDDKNRVREALLDILVQTNADESGGLDFDETELQNEIDDATHGVTLSDLIIEERRNGR